MEKGGGQSGGGGEGGGGGGMAERVEGLEALVGSLGRLLASARLELQSAGLALPMVPPAPSSAARKARRVNNKSLSHLPHPTPSPSSSSSSSSTSAAAAETFPVVPSTPSSLTLKRSSVGGPVRSGGSDGTSGGGGGPSALLVAVGREGEGKEKNESEGEERRATDKKSPRGHKKKKSIAGDKKLLVSPPASSSPAGSEEGAGAGAGKAKASKDKDDEIERRREIESAVRGWAEGSPASPRRRPLAASESTSSSSSSSSSSSTSTSSPTSSPHTGRIRSRAYALAASEGNAYGWTEIRERRKDHAESKDSADQGHGKTSSKKSKRESKLISNSSSLIAGEVMEAMRRDGLERGRQLETFFDSMERTYIEERERREREKEEKRLSDLESEFVALRAQLRDAIAANAGHAHTLADQDKRIEMLQSKLSLTQRRVRALERDVSGLSQFDGARVLWKTGRARKNSDEWRNGSVMGGSSISGSLISGSSISQNSDDERESSIEDSLTEFEGSYGSSIFGSTNSGTPNTNVGVFFPSRRARVGSLTSNASGERSSANQTARQTSLVTPITAPGLARLAKPQNRPTIVSDELAELERRRSHSFGSGTKLRDHIETIITAASPSLPEQEPSSAPVTPLSPTPPDLNRRPVRTKEKNSKAFAVLGVDTTQAKLISVLGIDMPMLEEARSEDRRKKIKKEDFYIAPSWDLRVSTGKKNRLMLRKTRGDGRE